MQLLHNLFIFLSEQTNHCLTLTLTLYVILFILLPFTTLISHLFISRYEQWYDDILFSSSRWIEYFIALHCYSHFLCPPSCLLCTLWILIIALTQPSSSLCCAPPCPPCCTWSFPMSTSSPRWTWLSSMANWVRCVVAQTHDKTDTNEDRILTCMFQAYTSHFKTQVVKVRLTFNFIYCGNEPVSLFCRYSGTAFNLDFYTEVMDLTYLLDHLAADPFFKKFHHLNEKLAEVIQDYSLVSFVPLNVQVSLHVCCCTLAINQPWRHSILYTDDNVFQLWRLHIMYIAVNQLNCKLFQWVKVGLPRNSLIQKGLRGKQCSLSLS